MGVNIVEDYIVNEIRKNREEILKDNDYELKKLRIFQEKGLQILKNNGWKIITKEDVLKAKTLEKIQSSSS